MKDDCEHDFKLMYYRVKGKWFSSHIYYICNKCKDTATKSYVTKSKKEVK